MEEHVYGAALEGAHGGGEVGAPGHEHDPGRHASRAQLLLQREPVEPGKADLADDAARPAGRADAVQGLPPVAAGSNLVAVAPDEACQPGARRPVVGCDDH
jgi:hypothetical protein